MIMNRKSIAFFNAIAALQWNIEQKGSSKISVHSLLLLQSKLTFEQIRDHCCRIYLATNHMKKISNAIILLYAVLEN